MVKQIVYRKSLHEIKQSNRFKIQTLPEQLEDSWEDAREENSEQLLALQQASKNLNPNSKNIATLLSQQYVS